MCAWPAAVVFDFDGVIVNSEPLHLQAFQAVLAAEHLPLTEEEYYQDLIGFDDRGAFRHMFQKHGRELDPKSFLRVMTRKSEMLMELIADRRYEALPGVEEFVRGLWRKYPLAICSGALREEIEAMLEGIRLRDCFPTIVAAQDVTVGKPDPQGYLLTTKLLGERMGRTLSPADVLIVEDAPSVIHNVRPLGFAVLAVPTSHPMEDLHEANYAVRRLVPADVIEKVPQLRAAFS